MKSGFVYFIEAVGADAIKIGWAMSPARRLIRHQISCPIPLKLLAAAPGSLAAEGALHSHFSDLSIRGEWFKKTFSLMEMISIVASEGALPEMFSTAVSTETNAPQRARVTIDRLGGISTVARDIGTNPSTVSEWARRGNIPARWYTPLLQSAQRRGLPLGLAELVPGMGDTA